jgi:hypothetical protein
LKAAPAIALRAGALLLLAALIATAAAALLWHLLPYHLWEAEIVESRFLIWEATSWMLGLVSIFFALASLNDAADLFAPRTVAHLAGRLHADDLRRRPGLFAGIELFPWLLLGYGLCTIALAAAGRAWML